MTLEDVSSIGIRSHTPVTSAVVPRLAEANKLNVVGKDWPRWRGPRGNGTWHGPTLPTTWPTEGLRQIWRQPVGGGYGGVAVAEGRVYLMDRQIEPHESERLLCFDAATGNRIWTHVYVTHYGDLPYGNGPRGTPTLHDGHVYSLGALGHLNCLDAKSGELRWSVDLVQEHNARVPLWGISASPVVFENLLIVHVGAEPNGCLLALQLDTGGGSLEQPT